MLLVFIVVFGATPVFIGKVGSCSEALIAIHNPNPAYPTRSQAERYGLRGTAYDHVMVEGSVGIEYTVTEDGRVSDARITDSNYKLVGRNAGRYPLDHFKEFLEINVLPSFLQWSFEPLKTSCTATHRFTWELDDDA